MTLNYQHPLELASPLMTGDKVKEAQKLLSGGSKVLNHKVYSGQIDGQYGEHTAHATREAKYWLGYPRKEIDSRFGETLYEILTGKKKRSLYWRWIARHRKKIEEKRKESGGLYKKAIDEAAKYVGYKDNPVTESNIFGIWYGANGVPWCAIFESYVLSHVGRPFRYSYVPNIVGDARMGHNKLRTIPYSEVQGAIAKGHAVLACFDFARTGIADHTEFVVKALNNDSFETIGGNTGQVSFQNGGEVLRSTRYTSVVQAFVLVYE